jgi:hypothetical protein
MITAVTMIIMLIRAMTKMIMIITVMRVKTQVQHQAACIQAITQAQAVQAHHIQEDHQAAVFIMIHQAIQEDGRALH